MRHSQTRRVLTAAFLFFLSFPAKSQNPQPCVIPLPVAVFPVFPAGPGNSRPFSASVKVTFDQKLADGNSIYGTVRYRVAHDSSGKTMAEQPMGCPLGDDGHYYQSIQVTVTDGANNTVESWQLNNPAVNILNIAFVRHIQPIPQLTEADRAAQAANADKIKRLAQAAQAQRRTEDLGSRLFQGVSTHGTRTTQTIPAGEQGNLKPLEIVSEVWRPADLGLVMLRIEDDPRRGKLTTEVEELRLGEPDPSIFSPPPGYTVREQKLTNAPIATTQ